MRYAELEHFGDTNVSVGNLCRDIRAAGIASTRELDLAFLVCFSSLAGVLGNAGQADYALANAFMDAYTHYRNELVARQQRRGRTLSINWPLWRDGGLRVDGETEAMIRQRMGMVAMQQSNGIKAFYQCLASGQEQVIVIEGDHARLRAFLGLLPEESEIVGDPLSYTYCLELAEKIAQGDMTEEQLTKILVSRTRGESYYGL